MQATTHLATAQALPERQLAEAYFRTFNENQFEQTAALFANDGELVPPFDSPVVGVQAIFAYLQKEAADITAYPKQWKVKGSENNRTAIEVTGKVNAIVFKVNVAWYFAIAPAAASRTLSESKTDTPKIERVRIKLLASPKELLGLKSTAS